MQFRPLAGNFTPASRADWMKSADKALSGAPFSSLKTALYEGFEAEPLYSARDGKTSGTIPFPAACATLHAVEGASAGEAAEGLRTALAAGASGLFLSLDGDGCLQQEAHLRSVLATLPAGVPLFCEMREAGLALLSAAMPQSVQGSAGLDPLSDIAGEGELPLDRTVALADAIDAAHYLRRAVPSFIPFTAADRVWHGAGGSAVEELAFTLAAAVSYWRSLTDAGVPAAEGADAIAFRLTATSDIFLSIAKFRAMRRLWAKVQTAVGETDASRIVIVWAETSPRDLTLYDPHVNLLRGTAAAFAAITGGANAVLIQPFDRLEGSSAFSARLSRNTAVILEKEAHLRDVADAAAGSWAIENLTETLCSRAWSLFRAMETEGGLLPALEKGFVQDAISRVDAERKRNVARRIDKITGVSAFPNEREAPKPVKRRLPSPPAAARLRFALPSPGTGERFAALSEAARQGASLPELTAMSHRVSKPMDRPLAFRQRTAEPFEHLRQTSDTAMQKLGVRPPVLIALLDSSPTAMARLGWVSSLFLSAGIQAVVPDRPSMSPVEAANAFRQNPSPVVCICGGDAAYAARPGVALALREAGATMIYLAADPSVLGTLDARDAACLGRLLYEGCDAAAILAEAHGILRVGDLAFGPDDDHRDYGSL